MLHRTWRAKEQGDNIADAVTPLRVSANLSAREELISLAATLRPPYHPIKYPPSREQSVKHDRSACRDGVSESESRRSEQRSIRPEPDDGGPTTKQSHGGVVGRDWNGARVVDRADRGRALPLTFVRLRGFVVDGVPARRTNPPPTQ